LLSLADVKVPPACIYYAVSCDGCAHSIREITSLDRVVAAQW
jgi:hypothetical protein